MIVYRTGNCVRLLQNGTEFFPALEEAIDAAQSDVYLETYIYADDPSGREKFPEACCRPSGIQPGGCDVRFVAGNRRDNKRSRRGHVEIGH